MFSNKAATVVAKPFQFVPEKLPYVRVMHFREGNFNWGLKLSKWSGQARTTSGQEPVAQ